MNLKAFSKHLISSFRNPWFSKHIFLIWVVLIMMALAIPTTYGFGQEPNNNILPPGGSGNAPNSDLDDWDLSTNQIIVKYRDLEPENRIEAVGTAEVNRMSTIAGVDLTYVREMSGKAHVFRLPSRMNTAALTKILERLSALPEVAYAEPDSIMRHTATPNDPLYPQQWHYFAPTSDNYGINLPPAWDLTGGLPSVVVAVIDTGITHHIEFVGQTVPGYDFITDLRIANDGDGRDNDPSDPGDWITAEESAEGFFAGCPIRNSSWHGSHVAGTIAAASNNGIGVAGINWNAKILPVRVLGKCGGYTSDIVDGMRWSAGLSVPGVPANANPAKVLNLSLGGSGPCDVTYQNAINAINAVGATVVAAAGNNNSDASNFRPANCNGVIAVAATTHTGQKAYYSNTSAIVDISAPGGDSTAGKMILSTVDSGTQGPTGDDYKGYQGTSMAAPHVSGVVSLLYAADDSLQWNQVRQILQNTVTPFPAGSTCTTSICGSGIVNAYSALLAALPTNPPPAPTGVTASYGAFTDKVRVTWNASSGATYYRVYRNTSNNSSSASTLTSNHSASPYDDTSATPGITYHYWVKACNTADCSGFSSSASGWRSTTSGHNLYLPLIITGGDGNP